MRRYNDRLVNIYPTAECETMRNEYMALKYIISDAQSPAVCQELCDQLRLLGSAEQSFIRRSTKVCNQL